MGKDIKTPGNIKFGDMPADYKMRYKQMIEKHNKDKKDKKNKKKDKGKSRLQQIADKLYGGSK